LIIKFDFKRLFIIITSILLFPLIQKQWFNLYLFNTDKSSIYFILYYLSGFICPFFVCFNSISKFTFYSFNNNKNINNNIDGKKLLFIYLFILTTLSILILNYFTTNIVLFYNLAFNISSIFQGTILKSISLVFIISILLIIRRSRIFLKKLILLNFFIFTFLLWHSHINSIFISNSLIGNRFFNQYNINFINILYISFIELLFYMLSFLSNKNNLSDWCVPKPNLGNLLSVYKIAIFYLFIFFYYSILES